MVRKNIKKQRPDCHDNPERNTRPQQLPQDKTVMASCSHLLPFLLFDLGHDVPVVEQLKRGPRQAKCQACGGGTQVATGAGPSATSDCSLIARDPVYATSLAPHSTP